MSDTYLYLAFGLTAAAGVLIGMVLAAAVLLEHPLRYVICLRISAALYKNLREAAQTHGWNISTEVTDRLTASFERGQP
jgi:hypothetical protein